jgi:hypothetical protein
VDENPRVRAAAQRRPAKQIPLSAEKKLDLALTTYFEVVSSLIDFLGHILTYQRTVFKTQG